MTLEPRSLRHDLAGAALLYVVVALAYLPVRSAGLVFDDHLLLRRGGLADGPLADIWFSTKPLDYWPLTYTTFWLDARLWDLRPLPLHVENLALHALSAIILWRLLRALRVPGALIAALLFAAHPTAVESVAWISERKNVLSAPLFFGAALAWLRSVESGSRREWLLSIGLFALALAAKSSAVVLPIVLAGAAWARSPSRPPRWRSLAPHLALASAAGALALWFQTNRAAEGFLLLSRGVAERIGGAAWAFATYAWTAYVPVAAKVVYAPWPVAPGSPLFYAPLVGVVAAAALLVKLRHGAARPLALALGYQLVVVLPVVGLVDMAYFHVGPASNHLQYLALAGPCALVGAAIARLSTRSRRLEPIAATALVVALVAWTSHRAAAFEDDVTLWRAAVDDAPGSLYASWMLSDRLAERGDHSGALNALRDAAARAPDEATHLRAEALLLFHLRDPAAAVARADAAEPLRSDPPFRLQLASLAVRAGDTNEGLALLEPLVRAGARSPEVPYWAAAAYAKRGQLEVAIDTLRGGVELYPRSERLQLSLALLLARSGHADEARRWIARALRRPESDEAVTRQLAELGGTSQAP